MLCDRCRLRITNSANPDQPLCARCCAHLRAGGAWELSAPYAGPVEPIDPELLPLRAHLLLAEVPSHPTDADFQHAAGVASSTDEPAAWWRLEAIRARRQHPGCDLGDPAIAEAARNIAERIRRRSAA